MRKLSIPKGNGKVRIVYAPDKEEKKKFKALVNELNDKCLKVCNDSVVHGFMPRRSPVTNALAHVGYNYSICFDLENFFDAVTPEKVRFLSKEQKEICFVDGAARQGLPTSPAVANLAAVDLDTAILKWIKKTEKEIVYTRYADDLTLSFNDPELISVVKTKIPEIVRRCGFAINQDKTHVQAAIAGRRIICGVAVDSEGIHPTRDAKRRLRAALHQNHTRKAQGLAEWCKLKLPGSGIANWAKAIEEANILIRYWELPEIDVAEAVAQKVIKDRDLGDNCFITNDPVMFLGMSTFAVGWDSCLHQPHMRGSRKYHGGGYREGVVGWLSISGASLAVFLDSKIMQVNGIARRRMKARVVVYQLENGQLVYDKLYYPKSKPEYGALLEQKLQEAGFISVRRSKQNVKDSHRYIIGNIPMEYRLPYLDSLKEKLDGKFYRLFV